MVAPGTVCQTKAASIRDAAGPPPITGKGPIQGILLESLRKLSSWIDGCGGNWCVILQGVRTVNVHGVDLVVVSRGTVQARIGEAGLREVADDPGDRRVDVDVFRGALTDHLIMGERGVGIGRPADADGIDGCGFDLDARHFLGRITNTDVINIPAIGHFGRVGGQAEANDDRSLTSVVRQIVLHAGPLQALIVLKKGDGLPIGPAVVGHLHINGVALGNRILLEQGQNRLGRTVTGKIEGAHDEHTLSLKVVLVVRIGRIGVGMRPGKTALVGDGPG